MLDRKFIIENAEAVKQNCDNRNVSCEVDKIIELESSRRDLMKKTEDLNREANAVAKSIGAAKDAEEREARKEQGRALREQKDAAQAEHDQLDEQISISLSLVQRAFQNLSTDRPQ